MEYNGPRKFISCVTLVENILLVENIRDLYEFVQKVIFDRGWHSQDEQYAKVILYQNIIPLVQSIKEILAIDGIQEPDILSRLTDILSLTDGILFSIAPDGLIKNVYGMKQYPLRQRLHIRPAYHSSITTMSYLRRHVIVH